MAERSESSIRATHTEILEMDAKDDNRKRLKPAVEDHGAILMAEAEIDQTNGASPEMELHITQILEKLDSFTNLVSELLESGKTMFKELSNEFEERMITIHKEQTEKWMDEIKELRLLDASNEEAHALLHNARYLLQNPHVD
ncbi:hypothetical protein CsatB_005783 [Cannabis sativa]|uniref:Knotted 1-binding protein n=4 Tax=Cannabis sativa TaxID=3483 RepID=A0AB40EAQ7_CANSA|nr:uncharacterized protein LOC115715594 isoform X1 [Cannabis sativa]XP_060963088.1 uncharacterized protein LOC133032763 isoform X1 [Cannabis sativa]XP_060963089.1 uncharacterized protein LOC133032763 isoform X1 [Cannabis sativa]KAF4370212.1 hypothetical protein F8388_007353 [Cannabis sativa]KAF4371750.1 hypothetical protein G4B88_030854 [Cannabis sativa]